MVAYKIIMLLLAVGAAATARPLLAAPAERNVVAPWRVAGVALGMSPREVDLAMQAAGYARTAARPAAPGRRRSPSRRASCGA
jgi:hypothetical protein